MPPKIVYGKKKTTARQQTSFNKFLSPEKLAIAAEQEGHSAISVVGSNWRQQLEEAAENAGKSDVPEDDLAILEKGLGSLRIEQTPNTEEKIATKKKGRPRRVQLENVTHKTKEEVDSNKDTLEQDMQALAIDGAAQEGVVVQTKLGRPRKVLEDRDANAVKKVDCQTRSLQKKQKQENSEDTEAGMENHAPARPRKDTLTSKPTPPQRKSQLLTPEPTPEPDDLFSAYSSSLRALSDRKKVLPFQEWSEELRGHFEITKIAEASFSEVYRLSATSTTDGIRQESVLKVIPLKMPPTAPLPCELQTRAVRDREAQAANELAEREENDGWKSDVADVLSEVKLLQNLNHIPGFTVFRDLTVVQGRPSASFNAAWRNWNKSRPRGKKSEFPDPSKKSSYEDTQLWAIVEMQDAGTDCEKIMELGGLTSIWEVWDVFWGVCLSVAKAEEACSFEHRDLHLGNICVRSSRPEGDVMQAVVKDPIRRKLRFTGLETTVIDYTLSRADIVASPPSRRSSSSSVTSSFSSSSNSAMATVDVAYLDLDKDPALFEGDASEEYQYEIYRYMRGAALYNNPLQSEPLPEPEPEVPMTPRRSPRKNTHIRFSSSNEEQVIEPRRSPRKNATTNIPSAPQSTEDINIWQRFHPKTNLVWTHFLLHKLLTHLQYLGNCPEQLSPKQMIHNNGIEAGEDALKVKKKAVKLYKVLQRVADLLCPVVLGREEGLGSVKELVVLSLEERWLRVGDVAG